MGWRAKKGKSFDWKYILKSFIANKVQVTWWHRKNQKQLNSAPVSRKIMNCHFIFDWGQCKFNILGKVYSRRLIPRGYNASRQTDVDLCRAHMVTRHNLTVWVTTGAISISRTNNRKYMKSKCHLSKLAQSWDYPLFSPVSRWHLGNRNIQLVQ